MTQMISSSRQFLEPLPQGYIATVTLVPKGLDTQHPMRDRYDDRSIAVDNTMGAVWINVEDPANGAFVATSVFAADTQVVRCDTIDVMKAYRWRGVGTAIYKIASRVFVAPVVPSGELSDDAKRFWGAKTQIT